MLAVVLVAAGAGSAAAQTYPAKPVRFIIPFAPGGVNDIIGRVVAQKLAERWKQSVVVDNRGGAGSSIGTDIAAKSPPDGYTLLLTSIALPFNAHVYARLPYDALKDLQALTRIADQPSLVVVHPRVAARTARELIELARAKPGALTFASAGTGSGVHFSGELFKLEAKVDLRHVPYKGTGPALNDLIGGQVDLMFSTMASALPHVQTARLRALAVTTAKRSPAAPDIPALAESAVPGFHYSTWYGLHVPARTPAAIVERVVADTHAVLALPEVRDRFAAAGVEPSVSSPAEFTAFVRSEIIRWGPVVRASGVRIE